MLLLILRLKVQLKSNIEFRTYFPREELKEFLSNSKRLRHGTGNNQADIGKKSSKSYLKANFWQKCPKTKCVCADEVIMINCYGNNFENEMNHINKI